ncbi:olfactory receptor 6N2-like [Conger conger]|uniref:olfactory receptor 6N2-like n=1 Tax=Conger conger TaxID=82655 RepID=UPI002A5A1F59|nr:olfactory receptor 6N2-like [Conger conger]
MIFFAVLLLRKLHTPMYILIGNLSLTDIIITTTVLPKIISVGLFNDIAISYSGCFLQQNIYLAFQATQSFLLGVMAFDRYVAICNPLRYNDIITLKICALLSISSWIIGILITFPVVIKSSMLPFCGDKMMFWFCDFPPVIALSCSDTTSLLFQALGLALFTIMIPGYVIIWTYSKIILTVCKIKSVDGRKKAFSTCSSHLTVVILFYGAHLIVYISSTVNNVRPSVLILISIINCILTPFANPIIYSFRNKELKTAIQKHFLFPRLHPL